MKTTLIAAALGTALIGAVAIVATAPTTATASASEEATVRAAIQTLVPDATIDSVSKAPLAGFYEVSVAGQMVYVSADGRYLMQGLLYDIANRVDLTEASRAKVRVHHLKEFGRDSRIVFAPEKPKHTVTVFTDIDCGYCRRLHEHMPEFNQMGIAVEYMFFPRGGPGSEGWEKAVSVWCSDDRRQAMTDAKAGRPVDQKQCSNPIQDEFELGARIGVTGTPMIITEDGTQVGGYLTPAQLLQRLEQLEKAGG